MTRRGEALEFAVLGLLHESPLHGYELRKRLTGVLGWGRVLSYGSLYPCLKTLLRDGLIAEDLPVLPADVRTSRRAKIVYKLTAEGKERFETLVSAAGPSAWDDDNFGVHFAFFDSANAETRIRILEGRRSRLEERIDNVTHRGHPVEGARQQLHPRTAAPRPGVGRARGALADRADRQRTCRPVARGRRRRSRTNHTSNARHHHQQHR